MSNHPANVYPDLVGSAGADITSPKLPEGLSTELPPFSIVLIVYDSIVHFAYTTTFPVLPVGIPDFGVVNVGFEYQPTKV